MTVKIVGSSVVISFDHPSVFLGSSAKGAYPPTGIEYSTFSFRPDEGEDGILAFSTKYQAGHTIYSFFQLRPEEGKIFLDHGIQTFDHAYLESPDFILGVQDGAWTYVVKMPKNATTGKYKVVGIVPLLEYIEGYRSLRGLNQGMRQIQIAAKVQENYARLYMLCQVELQGLQKALTSAEKALKASEAEKQEMQLQLELLREVKAQLAKDAFRLGIKNHRKTELIDSLGWLLKIYHLIPARLHPLSVRKTLRKQSQMNDAETFYWKQGQTQ